MSGGIGLLCAFLAGTLALSSDARANPTSWRMVSGLPSYQQSDTLVSHRVRAVIASVLGTDLDAVEADAHLIDDLGADKLDHVEMVMALEEEFGVDVPDEDAERLGTVRDAVLYLQWVSAGRVASDKPELGEAIWRGTLVFGGTQQSDRAPRSAGGGPRGGTATRALPRPRPSFPNAGGEPTTPGARSSVEVPPAMARDSVLLRGYREAVLSYYAALEEKNRADGATFARLEEYDAWALENRRRVIERQQTAAIIVLGVVILLVLVGVVFSGIQFYIAVRHSRLGTAPATTIKASLGSVEFSSSVLGVTILVISLLFFYLYLDRVFNLAVLAS